MRQSTARNTAWMEEERALAERWDPHRVRLRPDPYVAIGAARRDQVQLVELRVNDRGRRPQVCRYALSAGGAWPENSFASLAHFATRRGWVARPQRVFTDPDDSSDNVRLGWGHVRELVRAGFVDGVLAVTASAVSEYPDHYQSELDWFKEHGAFIELITPESPTKGAS